MVTCTSETLYNLNCEIILHYNIVLVKLDKNAPTWIYSSCIVMFFSLKKHILLDIINLCGFGKKKRSFFRKYDFSIERNLDLKKSNKSHFCLAMTSFATF